MEAIHVQLSYERRDVGVFEVLPNIVSKHVSSTCCTWNKVRWTHAKTLENSVDGDMTKLSLELDHEIKCCIL